MTSANNISPNTSEEKVKDPIEIILASWGDRFLAWIIDFVLVSIALGILYILISLPFWLFFYSSSYEYMSYVDQSIQTLSYIISSLVFFAYWTYFETISGQSIGKKILKIKITDLSGKSIDTRSAAIESFGKAFLLPLDVFLGWLVTNKRRQRIFNRISDTIVIKLKSIEGEVTYEDIRYIKD
jgi:uncharacterized RDD family membrane protein YckC